MPSDKPSPYLHNPNIHKNLIQNTLSREEFLAKSSEAGKKSGEVRKKKKAMRELARDLLNSCLDTEDEFREELAKRGVEKTEAAAILFAQLKRARSGDTDAARFLRDTSGQKPVDNVAIGNMDDKPFETLDLSKLTDDQLKALAISAPDTPEET